MKYKYVLIISAIHFALSAGVFLGLYGWAAGVQDAVSGAPAALGWIEIPLRFILLQPLAHWILEGAAIAWWTWPGLATVLVLFAVNSVTAVATVRGVLSLARRWIVRRGAVS